MPRTPPTRRPRRLDPLLHLRRHPSLRNGLALALAAVGAVGITQRVGDAEALRDAWGRARTVAVVVDRVGPGESLAGHLRARSLPMAAVPQGALDVRGASGRTARDALVPGEVVVAARLAPKGVRGPAARLGPGERGVAVPVPDGAAPPVRAGDRVDVVSMLPGGADRVLAPAAPVIHVGQRVITVAVPKADAADLAALAGQGGAGIVLSGP